MKAGIVAWFVLIAVLIVGGIVWEIATVTHRETVTDCKVVDKDRTTNSKGVSDARIYTENCGVFQVKDSWTSGTWSSADRYNKVKVGKLTQKQLREVAKAKMQDLNARTEEAAMKIIAGTARQMGVEVEA